MNAWKPFIKLFPKRANEYWLYYNFLKNYVYTVMRKMKLILAYCIYLMELNIKPQILSKKSIKLYSYRLSF